MERARFIEHKGKQIYQIDCTGATLDDIHELIEICAREVRCKPEHSVLCLTLAGGGSFGMDIVQKLKELTRGNAPYVKASALVGMTGLYKVILSAVSVFSQRKFYMFDDEESAKDFLADL
jgi:hypothetical protein